MSRICLNRFDKRNINKMTSSLYHYHHHHHYQHLFIAAVSYGTTKKINFKCKLFHQKKVFTTCRVRGQIIFFSSILNFYYAIKEEKKTTESISFEHCLSNNLIFFSSLFYSDKCFSLFLLDCCN